jgi:hypothetical protein
VVTSAAEENVGWPLRLRKWQARSLQTPNINPNPHPHGHL